MRVRGMFLLKVSAPILPPDDVHNVSLFGRTPHCIHLPPTRLPAPVPSFSRCFHDISSHMPDWERQTSGTARAWFKHRVTGEVLFARPQERRKVARPAAGVGAAQVITLLLCANVQSSHSTSSCNTSVCDRNRNL